MRARWILVLAVALVLVGGALLVPTAYARLSSGDDKPSSGWVVAESGPDDEAEPPGPPVLPPAPPTLATAPVTVPFRGKFFAWALLDRASGRISGSKNRTATNSTESMIKIWIVSDYLRRLNGKQPPAYRLKQAETAIRDSNDDSAQALWNAGGGLPVVDRLIKICGLTETRRSAMPDYLTYWSFTTMSPRDAVRMADCVADGKAAGSKWTKWVLDMMSKVRGSVTSQQRRTGGGHWGIVDGLPASVTGQGPVSIKNGWTQLGYDGNWHVNCLAVTKTWALAVMMRYPSGRSLAYGASVCASVATQLVTPVPGAALNVPRPLAKK